MKKLSKIILAVAVLFMVAVMCKTNAFAEEVMTGLTAVHNGTSVTVTGTVTNEDVEAVSIMIFDPLGNLMGMQSVAPNASDAFSAVFSDLSFTAGTVYTVKAANFDGGDYSTTTFTAVLPPPPAPSTPPASTGSSTTPTTGSSTTPSTSTTASTGNEGGTVAVTQNPKKNTKTETTDNTDTDTKEEDKETTPAKKTESSDKDTKQDTDDNPSIDTAGTEKKDSTESVDVPIENTADSNVNWNWLWLLLIIPVGGLIAFVIFKIRDRRG